MIEYIYYFINLVNNIVDNYYTLTLIIYFIFSLFFFMFSLPGGTILSVASGFFFGFFPGYLINILSLSFGSLLFIYFSKTLFKKNFNKFYIKYSEKFTAYLKNSSYEYLILLRLIIGPPLMFQNICISMLNVSNKKILISSLIGFTPIVLFFSYIGSYLSNFVELKNLNLSEILSYEFIFILLVIISIILAKIILKK